MRMSETPEIPLAPEARPLGEYGESQYLGVREPGGRPC
jgi:hypothetical protein